MFEACSRALARGFFALILAAVPASGQTDPNSPAPTAPQDGDDQAELAQLLAPVALYPDSLLAQVLMASTYPLELVKAQQWLGQNQGLTGNALAKALEAQPWDPSVKALAAFPSVVAMMNDELDWTQELGDAVLDREADVLESIQGLRGEAEASGSLQSGEEEQVATVDGDIDIDPTTADVIYAPYYDPTIVYGSWPWPAYVPIVWKPPAGQGPWRYSGTGMGFGAGAGVGYGFYRDAGFDWHRGALLIYNGRLPHGRADMVVWQHDRGHRGGVAYPSVATRNRYDAINAQNVSQRQVFRGFRNAAVAAGGQWAVAPAVPPRLAVFAQRAADALVPEPRSAAQGTSSRGHASLNAAAGIVYAPAQPPPVAAGSPRGEGGRR